MTNKPKLFDCFCFFNEVDLLRLRLETMNPVTDVFVIVESQWTHSGRMKPFVFDPDDFPEFRQKIRYVKDFECPGGTADPWRNENHQRNQVLRGLDDAAPEDFILISDLDEIPNPESLDAYDSNRYIRGDLEQLLFGYKLNNMLLEPEAHRLWYGTKITTFEHFCNFFRGQATSVRHWKSNGPLRAFKRAWFQRFHTQKISLGGWHFSWVLPAEAWRLKFLATAHQENATQANEALEDQMRMVSAGRDLLVADRRYLRLELSDSLLPPALRARPEAYVHLLLPSEANTGTQS